MSNTEQHHYWLASVTLIFTNKETEANKDKPKSINEIKLNVIFRTKEHRLSALDLTQIQQLANVQFSQKMPKEFIEKVVVIDVPVTGGITYLGLWEPSEFVGSNKKDMEEAVKEGLKVGKDLAS